MTKLIEHNCAAVNYSNFIKGRHPSVKNKYYEPYMYLKRTHMSMFSQFSSHISIILSQLVFEKQTKEMCKCQFYYEFDKENCLQNRYKHNRSQEKELEDHVLIRDVELKLFANSTLPV